MLSIVEPAEASMEILSVKEDDEHHCSRLEGLNFFSPLHHAVDDAFVVEQHC